VHQFEVGTCCTDDVLALNGTVVPGSPMAMSGTPPGRSSSKASDRPVKTSIPNNNTLSAKGRQSGRIQSVRASLCSDQRTGELSTALENMGVASSLRNRSSEGDQRHSMQKRNSIIAIDKGAHVSLPKSDNMVGSVAAEVTDAEILEQTSRLTTVTDSGHGGHNNAHAAIMIWLGILIDAVPESVVLGILASTATEGSLLTFVIGVFLANLPEAMSSSSTMAACGIPKTRIMIMWSSIVVLTAVGACVGSIMFPPGSQEEESSQYAIAAIEGLCGGAMLAMISNTALPEAFEQGGDVVGLSTVCGFLSALFVSVVSS
jgi:zinc transporter ZupT